MNQTVKAILAIIGGLVALAGISVAIDVVNGQASHGIEAAPGTSESTDPNLASNNAPRLWLENHPADDDARKLILRGFVKKQGQRCDEVESLLKDTVGSKDGAIWRMTCSPGYKYTFLFGADGKPTHFQAE
jgi:hypothetical protein